MSKEVKLNEYDQKILDNMKGKQIICNIESASRSGMNRKVSFYYIHENELIKCTYLIAEIAEYKLDKNHNLSVNGCGMDMIFSVLSNFNYAMAQRVTGKSITELLKTGECGQRIYDDYYIDANNYKRL